MGLDMYLYNSSEEKNENVDYLYDDNKTLYWRGNRDLHDLFIRYGKKREEEGYYDLDKTQMLKLLRHLMKSVMIIHEAAMTAHYEMVEASENGYDETNLFREYYVIGRILQKAVYKELRDGDECNCINLFDDENGKSMSNLINNLMSFVVNMKDDEHFVYLASY